MRGYLITRIACERLNAFVPIKAGDPECAPTH